MFFFFLRLKRKSELPEYTRTLPGGAHQNPSILAVDAHPADYWRKVCRRQCSPVLSESLCSQVNFHIQFKPFKAPCVTTH